MKKFMAVLSFLLMLTLLLAPITATLAEAWGTGSGGGAGAPSGGAGATAIADTPAVVRDRRIADVFRVDVGGLRVDAVGRDHRARDAAATRTVQVDVVLRVDQPVQRRVAADRNGARDDEPPVPALAPVAMDIDDSRLPDGVATKMMPLGGGDVHASLPW